MERIAHCWHLIKKACCFAFLQGRYVFEQVGACSQFQNAAIPSIWECEKGYDVVKASISGELNSISVRAALS